MNITRQLLEAGADPTLICMKDVNAFLFATCKEYFSYVDIPNCILTLGVHGREGL